MCGVWVRNGNLQCEFSTAIELAEERFAIEEPRVRKVLGLRVGAVVHEVRAYGVGESCRNYMIYIVYIS